jgi:hypothetical protein
MGVITDGPSLVEASAEIPHNWRNRRMEGGGSGLISRKLSGGRPGRLVALR